MNFLIEYFHDFLSLVFPEICQACGNNLFKGEETICLYCQQHLPYTNFHLDKENPVAKQFWGKTLIEGASACFHFRKGGKVQNLLHQLKYKGQEQVGRKVGRIYGYQLSYSAPFNASDIIIPVPLHKKKLKSRGYNQSECFALGLSESMQVPIDTHTLSRESSNETQTRKSRFQRHQNVESIFQVNNPTTLIGKHILLVDDVITTGSTLIACIECLSKIEGVRISVAAIAYAK
ncbi:ComF family protein [Solitalea sp. MAHUQ-68]|uniref:ComF family protein n=1 Tax=Solitalea agri TaxID=2953739 RepID=A0A9X2F7G8_9SPHI|nr:phosphoribosyltransferase family protein [Solitalea agri]MCO4293133.1 ComF family protein [Solitalea agri]